MIRVTPAAETQIIGKESSLETLTTKLSQVISRRGYEIIEFFLTFRKVLILEIKVRGLPDSTCRLELWGQLSDFLSEDPDIFNSEISLIVSGVYNG